MTDEDISDEYQEEDGHYYNDDAQDGDDESHDSSKYQTASGLGDVRVTHSDDEDEDEDSEDDEEKRAKDKRRGVTS